MRKFLTPMVVLFALLGVACQSDEAKLAEHLERVRGLLPMPRGLIETRARVARAVLESGGMPASS